MKDTSNKANKALINGFFQLYPAEAALLLNDLSPIEVINYLESESASVASNLFLKLNPDLSEKLVPKMSNELFIKVFTNIDPGEAARLLARVKQTDEKGLSEKMSLLAPEHSRELQELMAYPADTAGYFMDPRVMVFREDETIENALKRLRAVHKRRILDICIADENNLFLGIIPLQKVAVADPAEKLGNLLQDEPLSILDMSSKEEVVELLEKSNLSSLPVVSLDQKLRGVIRYDALIAASRQDASEDLQTMFGAGREERALSKATFAISKRLPWLEINLATAFLASAVVGMFEETIARITALAIFLPVVAGQSGNTGSQALAVTMRGLALREIRTRHWFQVARKEVTVGFVNGCAVALTTSLIVYWWESSFGLAVVIGTSMVISMVIAGLSGAIIPIILKSLGQDPAQSSSIILTTVTDIVGFMSFLGLATILAGALGIG